MDERSSRARRLFRVATAWLREREKGPPPLGLVRVGGGSSLRRRVTASSLEKVSRSEHRRTGEGGGGGV